MKRIILLLMLTPLCAASQAQVNPKIQQLFDKLTELGERTNIIKSGGKHQPTRLQCSVDWYYSKNMYYGPQTHSTDSMLREEWNKLQQQLSIVRHTLDELQEDAAESYHYEYHKGGLDTIVYSMNLCRDTTRQARKHQSENHPFFDSDEFLYFTYRPNRGDNSYFGYLSYVVGLPEPSEEAEKKSLETLTSDVIRLFKQNKIKPRKAVWKHDKEYSDSIWKNNGLGFEFRYKLSDHSLEGITNATIFTVPIEQEQKAWQILHQIDSIAQKFTDGNHDYLYRYKYNINFKDPYWLPLLWEPILSCFPLSEAEYYSISVRNDRFGFHFAITQTDGVEWIPSNWPNIKSFDNGKITYFKGMEIQESPKIILPEKDFE